LSRADVPLPLFYSSSFLRPEEFIDIILANMTCDRANRPKAYALIAARKMTACKPKAAVMHNIGIDANT